MRGKLYYFKQWLLIQKWKWKKEREEESSWLLLPYHCQDTDAVFRTISKLPMLSLINSGSNLKFKHQLHETQQRVGSSILLLGLSLALICIKVIKSSIVYDAAVLTWVLRFCISERLFYNVDATVWGPHVEKNGIGSKRQAILLIVLRIHWKCNDVKTVTSSPGSFNIIPIFA